ncbi:MAG: monofunctional biosynthetic peptidoglycan transglycosylase, partial [Bacteroidia bacterium]|nr:monofunctional biosynthetic peptidoglycan transglycosylase [Bacteroidia bacterium]
MLKRIFRILFKACLWFIAISIVSVLFFRFVPIPVTPLMLIRCVEQKWDGKEMKLKKDWVPLEKISSAMPLAVIAA